MDPYLESPELWPEFQHQFVQQLRETVILGLTGLTKSYEATIRRRQYPLVATQGTSLCEEDYIELSDQNSGKVVGLLDVVSPANKTTDHGRQAYLGTRRQYRGANFTELDLILGGRPSLDYSRDGLPEWDYAVTIIRAVQPDRFEIYTATLQKRLPRFRLPLFPDRDIVLDAQIIFCRCYDQSGFARRIDYDCEPPMYLDEDDYHWLDQTLTASGQRSPAPPDERVASAAYYLWEKEGRPWGRDRQHWRSALAQLRRERRRGSNETRS
jgi:hypothetical protein